MTKAIKLTNAIAQEPLPAGMREQLLFDAETKGLGLRKGVRGNVWFVQYSTGPAGDRQQRRVTIGPVERFTVTKAREEALRIRGNAIQGVDELARREQAAIETRRQVCSRNGYMVANRQLLGVQILDVPTPGAADFERFSAAP